MQQNSALKVEAIPGGLMEASGSPRFFRVKSNEIKLFLSIIPDRYFILLQHFA